MADNVIASAAVGSGATFVTANFTFSGDSAQCPGTFVGILSGSEGSWAYTLLVGGAGAVTAGTPRMTLASDDPAVASLASIKTAVETLDNAISGSEMQVDIVGALPAGANAIGKLAANSGVDIGDVDVTSIAAGDNNIGNVDIVTVPTDPFGANADAASATGSISAKLRFIAATGIPITGTVAVTLTSTTITGTVAVTQSGTWDEIGINDSGNSITVDGTVSVTGVSTLAEQQTQTTALQLIDDVVYTDDTSTHATGTSKGVLLMAAATPTDGSVSANDIGAVAMTTDRKLHVSVQDALPAGTNGIGKLTANSGVTIGAVEIAAAQTLAAVTTVTTVTTCSTVTTVSTLTGGGVAHDGVDSGNPVKVGAKAVAAFSTATMVANADRTDVSSDLDSAVIVRDQFPLGDLISERVSNTDGASTAFTNFGATASTRNVITAVVIFNSSATPGYVDFRDGTGGAILYTVPIPAGGGAVLAAGSTPYFKTTANTALAFDVSAALTTVYISISGFKSKVT